LKGSWKLLLAAGFGRVAADALDVVGPDAAAVGGAIARASLAAAAGAFRLLDLGCAFLRAVGLGRRSADALQIGVADATAVGPTIPRAALAPTALAGQRRRGRQQKCERDKSSDRSSHRRAT